MGIINTDRATAAAYFSGRGICLNHKIDPVEVATFINMSGNVSAEELVNLAAPKASPIHKYFEWDDKIAGHAYRLTQARHLVLAIQITDTNTNISTRAFESVVIEGRRAYVSVQKIAQSQDLVEQVIENALRELRYWSEKHQKFKNFFGGIFDEIKKVEERLRSSEKVSKGQKLRAKPRRKIVKANRAANKKTNGKHNNNGRLTTSR